LNYARIIEIKGLQLAKVNYYTIWIDGNDNPEFFDFATRMNTNLKNKTDFQELLLYINQIGSHYGALQELFHHEAAADALSPPRPYLEYIDIEPENDNFGLRLYCLRFSESVVILFNGDRKTTLKAQDCPNCAKYFNLAQRLSKAINSVVIEGSLIYIKDNLLIDKDCELTF
jgi:hypothetical protein